jgi:hypothetical protein
MMNIISLCLGYIITPIMLQFGILNNDKLEILIWAIILFILVVASIYTYLESSGVEYFYTDIKKVIVRRNVLNLFFGFRFVRIIIFTKDYKFRVINMDDNLGSILKFTELMKRNNIEVKWYDIFIR